ncbi:DUF6328 family protein [Hamadaea sp. NPDC051192]|uniref:DUF6328 family protein n=1 Tax=Hamadaea sp. NPDC051192 TaxID=3154940 RepID=UPI00343625A2
MKPGDDRAHRNYEELLQELRVAQTGVQILFAFLLTIPFTGIFQKAPTFDHVVYVITLIAAALATALIIAPASYHRMSSQREVHSDVLAIGTRLARAGLTALLVAILGSMLLVVDVAVGRGWAIAVTIGAAIIYVALWYGLPALKRRR